MSDPAELRLRSLMSPALDTLEPYRTSPHRWAVALDANESPWPLPEKLLCTLGESLQGMQLHRYPDGGAAMLRAALAAHELNREDELVLGVGSDELIALLCQAFSSPLDARPSILIPDPTFSMYAKIAQARGFSVHRVPLDPRHQLDTEAMIQAIVEHAPKLIFLATPNNPTGAAFSLSSLRAIVEQAQSSVVVLDRAYIAFSDLALDPAPLWSEFPNVVTLGTLSKVGLAGARIGWARARPWLARELEKLRLPYNLPMPSQAIAACVLQDHSDWLIETIAAIRSERERVFSALSAMPDIRTLPSDANFHFVECLARDAQDIGAALAERSIGIRTFGSRMSHHFRVSVGTPVENDAFLHALEEVLRSG